MNPAASGAPTLATFVKLTSGEERIVRGSHVEVDEEGLRVYGDAQVLLFKAKPGEYVSATQAEQAA